MSGLRTYQFNDPNGRFDPREDSGETHWIAAVSEGAAQAYARGRGWRDAGGEIFGEEQTASYLSARGLGGIDTVIPPPGAALAPPADALVAILVDALGKTRGSLANWMEIQNGEEARDYDVEAMRAADGALAKHDLVRAMVAQDLPAVRLTALEICKRLDITVDADGGNVDEAAFDAVRDRFGEDWATGVAQGEIYDGLLDYAQLHLENALEDEPEGMAP